MGALMAKLPLTVTKIVDLGGGLFAVTVAFADGTTANYIIPYSMATVNAVVISSTAMAILSDDPPSRVNTPHRKHRRYTPRVPPWGG